MESALRFLLRVRVMLGALLSTLAMVTAPWAHEVQPGLIDVELGPDSATLYVEWVIEAPVAGIDLTGVTDTNDAANAGEYDRLRALPPTELEAAFLEAWPSLRDGFTIRNGNTDIAPELQSITIEDVGNIELPRTSSLELTAPLPRDGSPVVVGWASEFGPVVVRQRMVENGYAGYLLAGALSEPIARDNAEQSAWRSFLNFITGWF